MKKLLLITLTAIICLFTTEIQNVANAKVIPPLIYDSNFSSDNSPLALQFRYADAILIANINDYIKLLNIQEDSTFTTKDGQEIFNKFYHPDYKNPKITLTNKAFSSLMYIIFYQKKHGGQLTRQISLFTDSQKKQYLVILYNIRMVSNLYAGASAKAEDLGYGDEYNSSRLVQITPLIAGLDFNSRVTEDIEWNMGTAASTYIPDVASNSPPQGVNVPRDLNNVQPQEKTTTITLNAVQFYEQNARMQYSSMLASENSKSNSDNLFFELMTKGLDYYKVNRDYVNASSCFTKAININPSKGEAWSSRGEVKNLLGDYNGAVYDYSRAIKLGYNAAESYYARACSNVMAGHFQNAYDDYKKAYSLAYGTKKEGITMRSEAYAEQLKLGRGETLRRMFINPYFLVQEYIKENGAMSLYNNPFDALSKKPENQYVPKEFQQKTQQSTPQKLVIPVGCRVYMIFARLKDTHAMVKYTTIAKTTDIENIVNSDSRFEWVRYESVPDQEYNNYPHY